jgi:hypothetical protein
MEAALTDDERAQARSEPPLRQAVVSTDGAVPAAYRVRDGIDFYLQPLGDKRAVGENSVTTRSTSPARMYEPGICCRSRTRERVPRRRDWLRLHRLQLLRVHFF